MQMIKDMLASWGIISPPEFFFGIGVCIGIVLLAISIVFRVFFFAEKSAFGRGWRYDLVGILACSCSIAGLVAVFTVPLFFAPSLVPDWCLACMAIGTLVGLPGLLTLLVSVLLDVRSLVRPRGDGEIHWARGFIFYVPFCLILPGLLHLYRLFGVR